LWFIMLDFTRYLIPFEPSDHLVFTLQYASVTVAALVILAAFAIKGELEGGFQRVYKYIAVVNLWLFVLFLIARGLDAFSEALSQTAFSISYIAVALMIVVTLLFGKFIPKISLLADTPMRIIGLIFSFLGLFVLLAYSVISNPIDDVIIGHPTDVVIIATVILVAVQSIGIIAIYDLTRRAVAEKLMGRQYLPLIVSSYIILVITVTLTLDYGLSFASFWISSAYVVTALVWTILGFVRRQAVLRHFGLGFALFSVVKLFVFDLAFLTQGFRVLSYFIMGGVLVAISFVYQFFHRRLELEAKVESEE